MYIKAWQHDGRLILCVCVNHSSNARTRSANVMQPFHHFRYWRFHQRIFITAVDSVSEPWTNRKKTCMCLHVYTHQWNQTYYDTPTDSDFERWLIKSDINDFWKEFPIVGVHLGMIPCQEYNQQHALGRCRLGLHKWSRRAKTICFTVGLQYHLGSFQPKGILHIS